jgi:hypothetical protein
VKPFGRWRWRRRAVAAVAIAVGAVAVVNVVVAADPGDDPSAVVHTRFASTSERTRPTPPDVDPVVDVAAALAASPLPPRARIPTDRPLRIAFLGDSVAWSTAGALAPVAADHGIEIINAGIWGCGAVRGAPFRYFGSTYDALPNDCDHWPRQWQAAVDASAPDVAVVMVGRWELMDRVHEDRWTHIGDPVFDAYLGRELDLAIAVAGSRGARVVLATTPYYRRGDAPGGGTWPEDEPARVDLVNALLRAAAARNRVGVADYGAILSPGGRLAMEAGGVRLRTDGVHIAPAAGPWMAPQLFPAIRIAAGV